jgi:FKBP-type peptidyl-prolyl cis-trans isomerase SlyD
MHEQNDADAVTQDSVVALDFTLRFEDGELAASSDEDGRLSFIQGRGHVFPVIERAVQGLRVGAEEELVLPPAETYGDYVEDAFEILPRDNFPPDMMLLEGMEIDLLDEETGAELEAIVTEVRDDSVVVDLNHPLAGQTLTLWFRVADVRPASEEELDHDHVHDVEHDDVEHDAEDEDGTSEDRI